MVADLHTKELVRPSMESNGNALRHGVYSRVQNAALRKSGRVRYRVAKAKRTFPWLADDMNRTDLRDWAVLDVLTDDVGALLVNLGAWSEVEGKDLNPRRLLKDFDRLLGRKLAIEDRLGMNYAARRSFGLGGGIGRPRGLAEQVAAEESNGVVDGYGYEVTE